MPSIDCAALLPLAELARICGRAGRVQRTLPTLRPVRSNADTGIWHVCLGAQVARDAFGSALSAERLVIRSQTWALTRDGLGGAPANT